MSEVQSRPVAPRGGRGSGRGGRGGFAGRGGSRQQNNANASTTNGDSKHAAAAADSLANIDDDGEMGQLKKQYGSKVESIKNIFGDWTDVDILFALRECNGDADQAVSRIAEGSISQWGEVSKKERTKTKTKGDSFTTTTGEPSPAGNMRPTRGGRGDGARGRGRATDRGGRGAIRAKPAQGTNGTRPEKTEQLSIPTEESNAWATAKADANTGGAWGDSAAPTTTDGATEPATTTAAPAAEKASIIPQGAGKTWASMLRQTAVPKPAPKPKEAPPKPPTEKENIEPTPPVAELSADPPAPEEEPAPAAAEPAELAETPKASSTADVAIPVVVPEIALPPSKDLLTETNLEQVHDESHPPPTETARSEATDSWDPRAANPSATPLSAAQQQHQGLKAPTSGYATTAAKATERQPTRTPSYTRRVLDQEEAVFLPGNRKIDSTAVQFGNLSFGGAEDDIDGDREEPETRTQPPDDSPVAHPRTSLPPVSQPAPVPQAYPTQQKPATSLPAASAPIGSAAPESSPWGATSRPAAPTAPAAQQQAAGTPQAQPSAPTAPSYGRFGPSAGQEQGFGQKPFDGFNQTHPASAAHSQYEAFQNQPQSSQAPSQQASGAFSSAPTDYSSYYTADQQSRTPYNYYNQQGYGQQQAGQGQGQQDGAASTQHRSASGYNANPQTNENLSQYPQSGASRFAGATGASDAQNSGNTTPNPPTQGQQGAQAGSQQQHGLQHQQQQGGQYGFNSHPYYQNPYYSQYVNQYQQGYGQGGYGGGPYGKGGFGQQQPYGMSPGAPYDQSSSQSSGFGQTSHRGESSLASGLGEYGSRAGGNQQSGGQQGFGGASGFGGGDSFARGGSSYQSQAGQGFNAQSQAGATTSAADDLKPFGDSKGAGGPSPSIGGARPGSATNTAASQSGLPPPQSTQQSGMGMGGYGGYPGHLQQGQGLHGNQSGSSGFGMGAGGNQGHGNQGYGGYGNQAYNNYYGGGNQQRGWGGNYH